MAPKRHLHDQPPPAPASSSTEDDLEESDNDDEVSPHKPNGVSHTVEYEDEKSEEDDEEDEEEDEDDDDGHCNRSTTAPSSKASQRQSSSDSGDGSTDESDTESDKTQPSPSVSDFTIKPSKPITDSAKPQKIAAKRTTTSSQASASKRANESNAEGKEAKKKKVSNVPDEDVKKGSGIQRIWSDDDEMALLKGMVEFQSKKGIDPIAEVAAFHEYIKNNLQIEVSTVQLTNKIRTVKKKFQTNLKKGENGEDPVFNKPRDLKIFELSKKIWANAANTNGVDKKKPTQSKAKNSVTVAVASPKQEEANGEMNAAQAKPCSNLSFLDGFLASGMFPESSVSFMKEAMPLIGSSKTKEFEQKWKKLQEDEFVLYTKKVELIHETSKLLLAAKKSST